MQPGRQAGLSLLRDLRLKTNKASLELYKVLKKHQSGLRGNSAVIWRHAPALASLSTRQHGLMKCAPPGRMLEELVMPPWFLHTLTPL